MPIYEYRCGGCGQAFEALVRSGSQPRCPHCEGTVLERLVSLTAPQGTSRALVAAGRHAAAREGHFSHYGGEERAKVKGG